MKNICFRNVNSAVSCLLDTSAVINEDTDNFANLKNGELWSPDDQCKLTRGLDASFCRVSFKKVENRIYFVFVHLKRNSLETCVSSFGAEKHLPMPYVCLQG
jgi:hypothetical protein